jgi:TM2 domain-containing membrane protein YozV
METSQNTESKSSFWTVFLCALFLGAFGVHRFITGKTKSGIVQLLTFGLCGVWTMVDLITILLGRFKNKDGLLISNPSPKKTWAIATSVCILGLAINGAKTGMQASNGVVSSSGHSSGNSRGMSLEEAKRSSYEAQQWAKNRIETSTHSKVVQMDSWGWDSDGNCHVFGGLIDSDRSEKYMNFSIRVGIDSSGRWNVQNIEIKH